MIFVFSEGGTGSVYFSEKVRVAVRPDTVWGFKPPLKKKPKILSEAFRARGGTALNLDETLEENLIRMLHEREGKGLHTMLSGRCCQTGKFLTDNHIWATCFVRHPLHSFVSFFGSRHTEHAKQFGGFNTKDAVIFYADIWNAILRDFIESRNYIYRFEYMPDELNNLWLKSVLKGWDNTRRNPGKLDKDLELLLKDLVSDNFYKLYEDWDM
jgi:hypothetical protein